MGPFALGTLVSAGLQSEPDLEIPYEHDYAGAPYRTQQAVRQAEQQLDSDTPNGPGGDGDLGALSAAYGHGLTVNGRPANQPWVDFGILSHAPTLSYTVASPIGAA